MEKPADFSRMQFKPIYRDMGIVIVPKALLESPSYRDLAPMYTTWEIIKIVGPRSTSSPIDSVRGEPFVSPSPSILRLHSGSNPERSRMGSTSLRTSSLRSSSPVNGPRQKLVEALAGISLERQNKLVQDVKKRLARVHYMYSLRSYGRDFLAPLAVEWGFAGERELYLALALDLMHIQDIHEKALTNGQAILAEILGLGSPGELSESGNQTKLEILLAIFLARRVRNIDALIAAAGAGRSVKLHSEKASIF